MQQENKEALSILESSPNISVRIDITNADRKVTLTGNGDEETSRVFFEVLKRLSTRIKNANPDIFTEPIYSLEKADEKEVSISLSKEDIEEMLCAILML